MTKKTSRREKGITLIALIVTIIVLLILAGVTINLAVNNQGMFNKAKTATRAYKNAEAKEKAALILQEYEMQKAEEEAEGKTPESEENFLKRKKDNGDIDGYKTNGDGTPSEITIGGKTVPIIDGKPSDPQKADNGNNTGSSSGSNSEDKPIDIEENKIVVADSLLQAMTKYNFQNDKFYKIQVNNVVYNIHTYVLEGNQTIAKNTEYGTEEDVGRETTNEDNGYAQNMVILKVNGDLTIEEGAILTAHASQNGYGGPKGMLVYCTGTLTNNGTISMTARGAKAEGQDVYLWKNKNGNYEYVPKDGGAGGATKTGTNYVSGNAGSNATQPRATGGGGTGSGYGYNRDIKIGSGGAGTSYSGGTGSGAATSDGGRGSYAESSNASPIGGAGSNGVDKSSNSGGWQMAAIGGTGNPSGLNSTYRATLQNYVQRNGTGGLLILYADKLQNNGSIEANGVTSSYGTLPDASKSDGLTGGSSGGGSVNLFTNNCLKAGNISAVGGEAQPGTREKTCLGGAGGNGSVSIGNISTGVYISY
jgi:type II secretory pathway pseudopilin PulG